MAALCVYAGFASEWERSTGVKLAIVQQLAERFREGVARKLGDRGVTATLRLVYDAASIPHGAVVIFACALGTESSTTFAHASACASAPALWDWVSPKHTYMAALVAAGIPIPQSWLVAGTDGGGVRTADLTGGSSLAECTIGPDSAAMLLGILQEQGLQHMVVKECSALGGTLAVRRLDAPQAVARAFELAVAGRCALLQPDLSEYFSHGETKCCVALLSQADPLDPTARTSQVLGARHAPPGKEFGQFISPEALPPELHRVATGAADVLRAHALTAGIPLPPVVRVDTIQLPSTLSRVNSLPWCVNEFELADFASWMWESACDCGRGTSGHAIDDAVCDAHARFIADALHGK